MQRIHRGALGALAALGVACGGDAAEPAATPAPMASTAETTPEATGLNRPPVIERVRLSPENPAPGQSVQAEVVVRDPEKDEVTVSFAWRVAGVPQPAAGAELSLGRVAAGDTIEVSVTASDGRLESGAVRAWTKVGNQAPLLHSVVLEPMGELTASEDLRARPRASDPDGDEITYAFKWWVNGRRMEVDGDVLPSGAFKRGDTLVVEVIATDGSNESEPVRSPELKVSNGQPRIVSRPAGIDATGTFRYQLRAEDPDGDRRLRYRLVNGPRGMKVDGVLGTVTWAPEADQSGRFDIEVAVDDMQGGEGKQRFELVVGDVPAANAAP